MNSTPHFPIYLDYSATNPCDPRVVDAMIPWLREHFGNPASRSHAWGWEAEEAVEKARKDVADLIGADPREIVWTSGATESNNLALKGAALAVSLPTAVESAGWRVKPIKHFQDLKEFLDEAPFSFLSYFGSIRNT